MSSYLLKSRQRRSRLKIYVHQQGKTLGPYSRDEIRRHLVNGEVSLADLVWHERLESWVALSDLPTSENEGQRFEMPSPPHSNGAAASASANAPVRRRVRERNAPDAAPRRKGWLERLFGGGEKTAPAPVRRRSESRRFEGTGSPFSALIGGEICGFDSTPEREFHLLCRTAEGRRCAVKMGGVRQFHFHHLTPGDMITSATVYGEANAPRELLARLERDETARPEMITQKYDLAKSGWNLLHVACRNGCQLFVLLDRSAPPPRQAHFDDDF
ncbi:MAG TPA: DUF4339 domain-containing protein [Chthoniobacteraceae bacterium]|nr:DUF4339 domain-containing protein [Chthoniobacteraceae bacterium]